MSVPDAFFLVCLACRAVESGTKILFLPSESAILTSAFQAACDRLDLICFDSLHKAVRAPSSSSFLTIQPHDSVVGQATVDLLHYYDMNRTAVVVDGPEGKSITLLNYSGYPS